MLTSSFFYADIAPCGQGPESARSFADILIDRAQRTPNAIAYTFLQDGELEEANLTFGGLLDQARRLAEVLRTLDRGHEPVLLMFPPGLAFVGALFGCLLGSAIAVPAYPLVNTRHVGRLESLVVDAGARVAMTTSATLERMRPLLRPDSPLGRMTWIEIDRLPSSSGAGEPRLDDAGSTVAILQYTSGSTGSPKGVVLTHENLIANARFIADCIPHKGAAPGVTWLPPYHDLGLMGGILHPMYRGFRAVMMSPLAFLQHPVRWLSAISKYRAVVGGAPNFAYGLLARSVNSAEKRDLDLSRWRWAFCGAEPIQAATIDRFVEAFAPCGFRPEAFLPGYGLAEATLLVTAKRSGAPMRRHYVASSLERHVAEPAPGPGPDSRTLVSCGSAPAGQTVRIVDPDSRRVCPEGCVGEIWVHGPNVSPGYWNRPDETVATFGAHTADTCEGPFLRTGDLGLIDGGELVVTGRLRDIIIIAGRNHYPQDLERTVESSDPSLRPGTCVAFAVASGDDQTLTLVVERDRHAEAGSDAVKASIRRAVLENHGIEARDIRLVRRGSVPLTSSGKLQRRACKRAVLDGEPWTSGLERRETTNPSANASTPPKA